MPVRNRVDRWATGLLLVAFVVALAGVLLQWSGLFSRFWVGLIVVVGEAGLVGGLADWFAVRALFVHPLGIRLHHTALIPKNRPRIVKELRTLVEKEWLTREVLQQRAEEFDFAEQALLLLRGSRPKLRDMLGTVAHDVLSETPPEKVAEFLARAASQAAKKGTLIPLLATLAERARKEAWLEPLLGEWVGKFKEWLRSSSCQALLHDQIQQALSTYQQQKPYEKYFIWWARVTGLLDLEAATAVVQQQIGQFAESQLAEESQLKQLIRQWFETGLERRLREDADFAGRVEDFLLRAADFQTLVAILTPVVTALRNQGLQELKAGNGELLGGAVEGLQAWVERLVQDGATRQQVNAWCRREAVHLIDKHHAAIGDMVEIQLNRLSDERLVQMIDERVGDDLNWIRINGTVVGCLVGLMIYVFFSFIERVLP